MKHNGISQRLSNLFCKKLVFRVHLGLKIAPTRIRYQSNLKPPQSSNFNGSRCKRIFVGGLKSTTTEATVQQYFSRFGKVTVVDTVKDKVTKRQKGFAYVTFADFFSAETASQQRFHNLDDRRVEVKLALSRAEMQEQSMHCGPGAEMMGNFPRGFGPGGNGDCFGNGNFGNAGNVFHPGNNMGPGPIQLGPFADNMGTRHMEREFEGFRGPAGSGNMGGEFGIGKGVPPRNMGQNGWSGDLGMRNSWNEPAAAAWNGGMNPRGPAPGF